MGSAWRQGLRGWHAGSFRLGAPRQEFKEGRYRFAVGPSAHGFVPCVYLAEDGQARDFRERVKEALKLALAGWGFGMDTENDAAGIFEGGGESPSNLSSTTGRHREVHQVRHEETRKAGKTWQTASEDRATAAVCGPATG